MDYLHFIPELLLGIWHVTGQMAPYLLFGFFVAGLLSVFVSAVWVERHLGGRGMAPVLKSVFLGVPLPLCSCGVIAVTASMRHHGASRGAAAGFLVATPQTGVDSMIATWGMLGPLFGVLRPIIALLTGIMSGGLVALFDTGEERKAAGAPGGAACGVPTDAGERPRGFARIRTALRYGFITLPRDIGKPLAIGLLIAGVIGTLMPEGSFSGIMGGGVFSMVVMVAVGLPFYICSTASIPIAMGFLHLGASPGAALAFLIAGPAANAATFTTVWKLLGPRAAFIVMGAVFFSAIGAGLGFDALFAALDTGLAISSSHIHGETAGWLDHASAAALVIIMLASMTPARWWRGFGPANKLSEGPLDMADSLSLQVSGMTCSHCTGAVERGLLGAPGVTGVSVDLESGCATIHGEGLDAEALAQVVRNLGYEAGPLGSGA
jgi:uncharacterized membrane protein YraQ (UPF0718 family)/copper chaperone CopZ